YGSGGDVVSSGGAGADVLLIVDSCPIDANGDGVDDYATVVQRSGAARRWGILDGVTGEIIALGSRDVEDLNRVFCLENGWFVTGAPDFSMEFVNARAPEPPVRVRGGDTLRSARGGEGCAWFETTDGTIGGVTLPGGVTTACQATQAGSGEENQMGLTDETAHYGTPNGTFTIRARERGTEVLTVSYGGGQGAPWSQELPYEKPTFGTTIAATADRVFVVGSPVGQDEAHLVALDAAKGRQLFDVPVAYEGPDESSFMHVSGTQVVASIGWSFCAFEAATGESRWCIGP
ncbi:MAG: PQQ-binding-like beta-propeller repeat protein, partial [Myxococcota bacterium]